MYKNRELRSGSNGHMIPFAIVEVNNKASCVKCEEPISQFAFRLEANISEPFCLKNSLFHQECWDEFEDKYYKMHELYPDLQYKEPNKEAWL